MPDPIRTDAGPGSLTRLPLFPLGSVLFPHATLFLHIFEPRYREMVEHCRETGTPFGVVLIREGTELDPDAEPYMVGTLAHIRDLHRYPDGRLDIGVQGGERFRVRFLDRETSPYFVGGVEALHEEPAPEPELARLAEHARGRFFELVETALGGRPFEIEVAFTRDPVALSFAIANLIDGSERRKQAYLELTDTVERYAGILPGLEEKLAALQAMRDAQAGPQPLTPDDVREFIHPN